MKSNFRIDVAATLDRGGADALEFLHFCVYTQRVAPLFVVLAREYRYRPTPDGAIALYEVFCAPGAPVRIDAAAVLSPLDLRLEQRILRLRAEVRQLNDFQSQSDSVVPTNGQPWPRGPSLPATSLELFDRIVSFLTDDPGGPYHSAGNDFDPSLTAMQNLPGGTLSPGQRAFVENLWRPRIRPRLMAAGFWRVATVGQ